MDWTEPYVESIHLGVYVKKLYVTEAIKLLCSQLAACHVCGAIRRRRRLSSFEYLEPIASNKLVSILTFSGYSPRLSFHHHPFSLVFPHRPRR